MRPVLLDGRNGQHGDGRLGIDLGEVRRREIAPVAARQALIVTLHDARCSGFTASRSTPCSTGALPAGYRRRSSSTSTVTSRPAAFTPISLAMSKSKRFTIIRPEQCAAGLALASASTVK